MLYEITPVQQADPQLCYRWFTSDCGSYNLYIWERRAQQEIVALQWSFPDEIWDRILSWKEGERLRWGIVEADDNPIRNRSPLIRNGNPGDLKKAIELFHSQAGELQRDLWEAVIQVLKTIHPIPTELAD